jgi:predicted ATP-dependent serine protease
MTNPFGGRRIVLADYFCKDCDTKTVERLSGLCHDCEAKKEREEKESKKSPARRNKDTLDVPLEKYRGFVMTKDISAKVKHDRKELEDMRRRGVMFKWVQGENRGREYFG